MLEEIFERFRQVNSSYIRSNEGSGIGLSIVKAIVELHGGQVFVESQLGNGSNFIIKLPVRMTDHEGNKKTITLQPNVERIQIEFSDIYE